MHTLLSSHSYRIRMQHTHLSGYDMIHARISYMSGALIFHETCPSKAFLLSFNHSKLFYSDTFNSLMEFKELVEGVKIPALGLGTWEMGEGVFPFRSHDKECIAALKRGIELGMTHIDTAEIYSSGRVEKIVAEAIKDFDREKLFITSKVWQSNLRYNDVIKSAKGSLKRLGIEQTDLYLVHWPNPNIPLKETMRGMEYLIEQELTRFIGVSNFDVKLVKEAQSYLDATEIVADQIEFSFLDKKQYLLQEPVDPQEVLRFCQKEKMMLIAYSPLARGMLFKRKIPLLEALVKKYDKTVGQIALNWLISKNQVITIPKASNVRHVEENAGAVGWRLSNDDIANLDKLVI